MTQPHPTDARTPEQPVEPARPTPRSAPASRRAVFGGVLGVGVGVPLVAACGSGSDSSSSGSGDSSGGSTTSAGPITTTSKVPVGGGVILAGEKVVVTQPTEGEFKAFTAVCPHQQCLVTSIKDEEIDCSCHGSKFSITDGSVIDGPADQPLSEMTVSVEGEDISVS
ncbi:Rieske (2Fe-2S) protein [Nocardioides aurantiacus]|uniref:Rieske (2Fe-2S) protein n=1 Tax=Nocardioides aurantiacus TaxID=86796 RepID=UPI00403F0F78